MVRPWFDKPVADCWQPRWRTLPALQSTEGRSHLLPTVTEVSEQGIIARHHSKAGHDPNLSLVLGAVNTRHDIYREVDTCR